MLIQYEALNRTGQIIRDTLVADDMDAARAEIADRGLTPVHIRKSAPSLRRRTPDWLSRLKGSSSGNVADANKAARKELPFFTTQLAILLETGTPLAPSLAAINKQVRSPHWQIVVRNLSRHVEEGGTLASAVGQFPRLFDPVYVSMISAGEASGRLPSILSRLAELARRSAHLRGRIQSALIYPSLLVVIASMVLMVLIFFVLPRFAGIFEEMEAKLPASTKALLALSAIIRENIIVTILAAGSVGFSLFYWLTSATGKRTTARWSLKVPIFGSLISALITARIFRLIGILVESEVPLIEALQLTRFASGHYLFVEMLGRVYDNVLVGRAMNEAMAESRLVSPSIVQMVQTGEENGQVGKVMRLLADYLDEQNDVTIGMLTSVMEPVILIFMGLIIGVIAISLVLPMFDLSQISGAR